LSLKNLGLIIKNGRKRRGYTQQQLAGILGVHFTLVSKWELGQREPMAQELIQIAKELDIISELFPHLHCESCGSRRLKIQTKEEERETEEQEDKAKLEEKIAKMEDRIKKLEDTPYRKAIPVSEEIRYNAFMGKRLGQIRRHSGRTRRKMAQELQIKLEELGPVCKLDPYKIRDF